KGQCINRIFGARVPQELGRVDGKGNKTGMPAFFYYNFTRITQAKIIGRQWLELADFTCRLTDPKPGMAFHFLQYPGSNESVVDNKIDIPRSVVFQYASQLGSHPYFQSFTHHYG